VLLDSARRSDAGLGGGENGGRIRTEEIDVGAVAAVAVRVGE
jgi:hypothetical protein